MELINRKGWGAKPPKEPKSQMVKPAPLVFIHHSVTSGRRRTKAGERKHMRELQQIAFNRGFADISYSFVVFRSGRVYKGRGWGVVGAHTEGTNSTAYGICFVGNFESDRPTRKALEAAGALIRRGKRYGYVRKDAIVDGHREAPGAATACPGKHLFAKLDLIRKEAR